MGAPDQILSAAASTNVHVAELAAVLREARHAAQCLPQGYAACSARTAKRHALQAPCNTEPFCESRRGVNDKRSPGAVLHKQATTRTSSAVALATFEPNGKPAAPRMKWQYVTRREEEGVGSEPLSR